MYLNSNLNSTPFGSALHISQELFLVFCQRVDVDLMYDTNDHDRRIMT